LTRAFFRRPARPAFLRLDDDVEPGPVAPPPPAEDAGPDDDDDGLGGCIPLVWMLIACVDPAALVAVTIA
jgi:hypothetical protein